MSHATSRCKDWGGGVCGGEEKCSLAGQLLPLATLHLGKGAQIPVGQLCLPHVPSHFCVPSSQRLLSLGSLAGSSDDRTIEES